MIKRYVSKYTGQQIDEAVKAIQNASYQVGLEDLTPELISEITKWIAEGSGGTSGEKTELKFKNHNEFPNIGTEGLLYIALDEGISYYWYNMKYNAIKVKVDELNIQLIHGGGATE